MCRNNHSGFTSVELIMVMAILAILMALAAPSFRNVLATQSIALQTSELAGVVRLARLEAVRRGQPVTICRTADPMAATPACAGDGGTTGWASGWIMFMDRNGNAAMDANDQLIRVQQAFENSGGIQAAPSNAMTFIQTGVKLGGAQDRFTFRPRVDPTDPAYEQLTRSLCVGSAGSARIVQGAAC